MGPEMQKQGDYDEPDPSPGVLLELVRELLERGEVAVAALGLAVEDVREEGHDATATEQLSQESKRKDFAGAQKLCETVEA